ncbi:TetR/AcrR family transcriptional regulator [Kitasatospora azatica]|uniref:TetR/AcrR family transcriptional regulator n=1 Tax=Kitasatospora azatica TaxID=58347 RepID=UPI0005678C73|nr:TetR/AcrR family transcriptional regulator [Kitasatospora azatica]
MPKTAYHHGDLRQALIRAGIDVARTGGPAAVVLRAVSREVGVSHNAAYRHFADREDLLAAVAAGCMERLGRLMVERTAEVRSPDPVERAWARLEAIGRAYIEFALTEHGWFRTAFSGAAAHGGKPPVPAADQCATDPYTLLAQRLDELVEVGALPAERRPGAQYAAWAAVHGLSSLLVDGPLQDLPEGERRAAADSVLATVSRGL